MAKTYLRLGDYNVICDRTGFKRKRSQCRLQWDGLLVKAEDWEPRHPQDLLRTRPEMQRVENARPEQVDQFEPAPVTVDDL